MEMNEIRREKQIVPSVGTLEISIAEEAEQILGYNATAARIESEQAVILPRLRAALAFLEIDILNRADVARYKMEKRQSVEREQLLADPTRDPWAYWNDVPIGSYRKAIPDFVLNKATQIKRQIPECTVEIEELQEHPDPFLKVKIGYAEEYYVEVWAEPTFERR